MKRRLTSAYDRMIMPDRCSRKIEAMLLEGREQQRTGRYARVISPIPVRHQGWAMGAALVCLLVVLSVGGTMLFLYSTDAARNKPVETIFHASEQETAVRTPEDHYAQVTNHSVEEVEAFAKVVRRDMLEMNWDALEEKIRFPLQVRDMTFQNLQEFVEWIDPFFPYSISRSLLERESCEAMFCNWQGICMAEGFIWLNEVDGNLKITAINEEIKPLTVTGTAVKQVPEVFADVLTGNAVYFYGGNYGPRTLEEYCIGLWGEVTVDRFAVVDMDGDGVCEVIVSAQGPEAQSRAHLVLRQDGKYICGYRLQPGEMVDLKKDGTFFRKDRDHCLYFNDEESFVITEVQEQIEKPLARWHAYPCLRPELVLESYEYVTGTGQNAFPGSAWYVFEGLITGIMENNWARWEEELSRWGAICLEKEGEVSVYDPDAPGRRMVGTLDEAGRFDHIAFYISNESGEFEAEVRELSSGAPSFWIDTHQDTMKRQVYTTAKLLDYLEGKEINDTEDNAVLREQERIRILMNDFMGSFMTGDRKLRDVCLVEGVSDSDINMPFGTSVEIISYDNVPAEDIGVGETCSIGLLLREVDDPAETHRLDVQLVKQESGWKILSCHASE